MHCVELDNVTFSYDRLTCLDKVSFHLGEGEFVGLIGPNGGGKTTLCRLLLGFLKPDIGTISVHGKDPTEAISYAAYVPQNMRFDRAFPITVLEVVLGGELSKARWYGAYRRASKKRAIHALEQVGMADLAHVRFSTLSGGKAQRALIARALVSDPHLLVLDEPTANVDANAEVELFDLLVKLKKDRTIVMVTHNLSAAEKIVDRVLCINKTCEEIPKAKVCEHFKMGLYHG